MEMEWLDEKDVSRSGVHLGIGQPDRSLRPPVSKTRGRLEGFHFCGHGLLALGIDWREVVVVHIDTLGHCKGWQVESCFFMFISSAATFGSIYVQPEYVDLLTPMPNDAGKLHGLMRGTSSSRL